MKKLTINNHDYYVPSSWDTMTKQQLLSLAKITRTCKTTMEIQLKFFLSCVGGRVMSQIGDGVYILKIGRMKHVLFSDEITALTSAFDWLFETNEKGESVLAPKLTTNHFKELRSYLHVLHGPGDALDNITYNQFVWLQTYHSILDDSEPMYLDELINIIYKTNNGKQQVKNIRRLHADVKTVILWYYLGTLNYLSERFPNVLNGSGDGDYAINVFDNQQRIIDSLAEGDVTKKEQVRESFLYDALYSMEMAAIRMQEMEEQHAKHK